MTSPIVSVVMPVHNSERYLEQAVRSVFAQTIGAEKLELLCVDDGSTDGSPALLAALAADAPCELRVLHTEHAGPGAARNAALDVARGRYVAFLDSDDFLEPVALEHAAARAEALDADVVAWDLYFFDDVLGRDRVPAPDTLGFAAYVGPDEAATRAFSTAENPDAAFGAFQNWPWNKLFRRELLEREGLRFPPLHRTEDCPFVCLALVKAERVAVLYERLSHYRVRTGFSAMDVRDEHAFDFLEGFALLRKGLEDAGLYETYARAYAAWAASSVIPNLDSLRDYGQFKQVWDRLHEGGFELLGLAEEPEVFVHDFEREALARMRADDSGAYLLWRSHKLGDATAEMSAAIDTLQHAVEARDARIAELEGEVGELRGSSSYKLGRALTWLPGKIKHGR